MNYPQFSKLMYGVLRPMALVRSLFFAFALCMAGPAMAAAPDLTAGGVPNDGDQWNLGPTGMAGWCFREGIGTPNARQFFVRSVAAGSPAAGIMAVSDVILGASGTGADPVNFTTDARIAFAQAITDAEERNPATLKILRWRAGVTSIVSLTLETLGAYTATAPYACPKSAAILEKGLQYMMATNASDGNWRYSALTLLAANDTANPNNAARQAKAATEMRGLILSPADIALFTSGVSMAKSQKPWHVGPKLIALSEYYLKTGDPDVLPSIRAYAHCAANGQSMFGTSGHFFSDPGFRNAPVNGPYNIGYGPVNNAGIPCYIGLALAQKCGLNDPEILAGIERAGTFFAQYTHLGCAGYGEHPAYEGHDTNGKAGMQALAFQFEGDRLESTKYYARASTAAAIAERDIGHTGSFFAFLYAPLGANVGGPDAMAYYFRETKWMYELARRWDGSFVYNSYSSGGVEVDALSGPAGCLMATPMLMTYAMPLRQTYMTGKNQNPANWVTPAEMPEVSAASAHIYNAPSRTTAELLSDLGSWSPKVRRYAARELKARPAEYANVLPILHAAVANEAGTFQSRNGACAALGEIGDTSSVPVLVSLVTHANFVVRYGASSALAGYQYSGNGVDLKPHVTTLMQACIANHKPLLPLDPQDPMQMANGFLCSAIFSPHAALQTHDLVGLDRNLLYAAMRVCGANPQAGVRSALATVYPKLTQTDIDKVADVFVNIAYENAPAGMGVTGARMPAMSFLQSKGKAEGVPLAIRFAEDIGYDGGGIVNPLDLLAIYAGSSNTVTPNPNVDHFCEVLIASGAKYGIPEAQAVLAAIAADTSPEVLSPFKNIEWIIPDDAAFDLPKKWTVLRVHSKNNSNPNSIYTWRKVRGAGAVSFSPNGTGAAKDATVVFDGTPGEYVFEVAMSDSHALTEVYKTVAVTLRNSGGTLPPNSPPTANGQSLSAAQGTPTQVILTGADPEGNALTYSVTSGPTHGSVSGTAPHLVYTAAANYTGADSIAFKVVDSEGQIATAAVSITVNAATPVGLAIYEPFNYAAGNLQGKSGASEIGLTGTWTAGSQLTTEAPSLTYGTLPTSGNRVRSVGVNSPGGSRPISPAALADRGLLDDGATVWFSVVMGGYGGWDMAGNVFHLALGNNGIFYTFPNSYNIPNDGITPGSGLGVRLHNKGVFATQFVAAGPQLTGDYDNTVNGGIINDQQRLVVGKITWGATSDTVEIYLPGEDMILPAPTSVLTANVDQSTFDTLTFSRGSNVLLDEIRFGATLQSVLQGTAAMAADVTAPTPNPMTFAVAPTPASSTSITMTATPAHDGMGVEYFFACTAGGGNSSGWQSSNVFTDTGLTPGVAYSYTVKARDQHPALNETEASAAATATIPALGTVPNVEGLPQTLAQTQIAQAALAVGTVTPSGAYSMTVPAGNVVSQSPSAGASVAYGSSVNIVISVGQNPLLPVLTPASIVDNRDGATVEIGTPVTFTLTFSKDMDDATMSAGDFINIGDAPITIGTIAEVSPGVVSVTVTPTGAGLLRFAVAAGAVIEDTLGNDLNTTAPIIDDTVISVIPIQPKTQTFTGNNSGSTDNWNVFLNWNINTGPIPGGNDNVLIPAGKQASSNTTNTPIYTGNLTLGAGAQLQIGYSVINSNNFNSLGTAGQTTITLGDGTLLMMRQKIGQLFPKMPAINLSGNAEINMGSSSSTCVEPEFNYPISGPYTLTLSGKGDAVATLKAANNFGELRLSTQYGTLFTVNANVAGALGGDVTVMADFNTGGKGANLVFAAANAMSDTATLTLFGNTGTLVTVNANDTIGALKLNGVKQLGGTYNSSNATWLAGTGMLTVAGDSVAYWNPSGGPVGIWDDTNIWNDLANLTGTNSAWSPGQIAAFNAAGTYGVTLSGTKEIGGLVVSNGTVTLADGELNLRSEAPVNIAAGASLTLGTVISENFAGLGLHKSGAGTLVLSAENTFTGPVAIGAGTLSVATIDNAGAPSALGQYPTDGPGGLLLAGGTLRYTGGIATTNRGFTFTGNSSIEVSNAGSSLTLGNVETGGPGTLTVTGGAGSSLNLGNIKIIQSNNITLNPTTASMSVASVEGYSNYPLNAIVTLAGSSTGNVVTGNIYAAAYPGSPYQQGTAVVKNGSSEWRLAGVLSSQGAANNSLTINGGTMILAGNNTYTGNTILNNNAKLVLDFAATNSSKIGAIYFSGGTLELKGGSFVQSAASTTLNGGPSSFITRNGGTAKLRMNAITRNAGSSISFLDGTVADTDRTNTNGILGGYATVGTNWAANSTNAADGVITALASYGTWTNSGGSAAANYLLSGSDALTGVLAANSLKIASTASNQSLNLGANNLTITTTSTTALGGVLYAGGYNNKYTISGTGGLLASSTTGELIIHTKIGTLSVNAPVVTSGATAGLLTKTGNGTLVLGGTNVFTGATRIASGKLFVNGSISNVNAAITVDPGATLGGAGTLGRNVTVADGGKLEFNLGTVAASHVPLTRSSSRTFAFSGASVLTITSNGGAAPGLYTLITGGNNITGTAPVTVVLPPGWTADAPVISGNQLRINITTVVAPPNYAPVWSDSPLAKGDATENAAYSATVAGDASDPDENALTFAKVSGPAWLSVAANGTISGTPSNSDVGANSFIVSASDGIAPATEVTLNITVINVNDAPTWSSNLLAGPNATEDAAYNQNIATAAADVDAGAALTFVKVSGPAWLSVAANGAISGTPSNVNVGLNVFTVSVSDGIAAPVEVTLNITVTNTNDAPFWTSNPVVGANANEDFAYSENLAASVVDVDAGASLTFAKLSGPAWLNIAANGALSGVPANSNVGANSFTVSVTDGIAAPVSATLNITVINTNDEPVAAPQTVITEQDHALPITLAGSDVDGDALTYSIVAQPAHGTLSGTGTSRTYTPTASYNGPDSFTFKVNDGTVDSAVATISITVTVLNDPPVALAQSVSTDEDIALPITLTGTDPDENPLTYLIVTQPTKGTLSGNAPNIIYTPTANTNGADSFTFKVNDGLEDSPPATISITVNSLNDDPVFTANPTVLPVAFENIAYTGQTLAGKATDADAGDTLTYSKINGPAWLTVAADGALSGTPPSAALGLNSFTVRVTDSASATAEATLEIVVSKVTLTWDSNGAVAGQFNGAGAWLGTGLWLNGASNINWAAGSNATFGGPSTSGGAVTLASPTTAHKLTFNTFTGTYTLGSAGQALTINDGINMTATSGAVTFVSPILIGAAQTWTNSSTGMITISDATTSALSGTANLAINSAARMSIVGTATGTPAYSGNITLSGGGELEARSNVTATNGPLGTGNIAVNGGIVGLYFSNSLNRAIGSGAGQIQFPGGVSGITSNGASGSTFTISGMTWGSATFNPAEFVFQNATANANGSGTLVGNIDLGGATRTIRSDQSIADPASGRGVFSGNISNGGIIKSGIGQHIFTGTNSYAAGTTISAGTLRFDTRNSMPASGAVAVADGATLGVTVASSGTTWGGGNGVAGIAGLTAGLGGQSGSTVSFAGNAKLLLNVTANTTESNAIANGAATSLALIKSGSSTLTLNGSNSYTGATTVLQGGITTSSLANSGSNSGIGAFPTPGATGLFLSGTTLTYTGSTASTNRGFTYSSGSNSTLNVSGAGVALTMGDIASNSTSGLNITGGAGSSVVLGNAALTSSELVINPNIPTSIGTVTLSSSRRVDNQSGTAALTVSGVSLGANSITFSGAASAVVINNATNITGSGNVTKSSTTTWNLSGSSSYTGTTSVQQGTLVFDSIANVSGGSSALGAPTTTANGTIAFGSGANTVGLRYTGAGHSTNRVLNLAGTTGAATLDMSGTGTLTFTSALTATGGGAKTLTLTGATAGIGVLGGAIVNNSGTNTTSLTKTGTGSWVLAGANSYTGTTAISAGTLLINGNQTTASGSVSVAANATLGGTGTIGGSTTIAADGKLEFNISTPAASHDQLVLASARSLTFSGASMLTINSASGAEPGTYTLLTAPGGITGSAPATLNLPAGWLASVSISGNDLQLIVTATSSPVVGFADDKSGGPVSAGTLVTYTVSFSEDMDAGTVSAADFGNAGSSAINFGAITETSPGIFTVQVTPTNAGNLQLKILAGAAIKNAVGSDLNTTAAILDDTILTVQSSFAGWSGGGAFAADANGDGISNGMAWVLGAADTAANAGGLKPVFDNASDANYVIYTYRRSDVASADANTTIAAEYTSTLGGWTTAVHDGVNVIITPTNDGGGVGVDLVQVKIKRTLVVGGQIFVRLKATILP